jgi:hypothetical protein
MLFISHATPEDNELARWLSLRLAAEGYPVWCDLTKLLGGEPFWKEIEQAIRHRTRKFIFILSKASNEKQGTRDELDLALTVKKQLNDDHFIIPLRSDDLPHSEMNIRIHGLNAIDFSKDWMPSLKLLTERLEEDAVKKDARFGVDSVAVWWRQNFGENEGVREREDVYLSNTLLVQDYPEEIQVIGLEEQPSENLNPELSPFPVAAHKRFLVSFSKPRELLPFIEGHKLHFQEGNSTYKTLEFFREGISHLIDAKHARNLVYYLIRQSLDRFAASKGLKSYQMANKRLFYWFPENLTPNDKITFKRGDDIKAWRQVVGKSAKTKDGVVFIRNWHFGLEFKPQIGRDLFVSVLPHVCFSENGTPYDNPKKQHRLRRSQCKSWYNDDWRDRILATLWFLSDGTESITVPLGGESSLKLSSQLERLISPVTHEKVIESIDAEIVDEMDVEEEEGDENEDE